ncbi:MAG: protoporphyrinogen oxidase [Sandaracinus sp.]|nr:protoporphyrinogen oxidase [Sandaracinus sp.]MCB9619836.1 protoporphyrinogen oxidase [Sandaracinus sp.]MCB9622853.1 protoporphyrinogen oxidase [Sandaracinus sp.]
MNAPVVVVGGGVAGLAAAWRLRERGQNVVLLERTARLGGLVESERVGGHRGWVLEHGPDGFLASKPGMREVLEQLGLEDEVVTGGEARRVAYVARGDREAPRLDPIPTSLFRFERRAIVELLRSPLLSWSAKLRLFVEPFVRRNVQADTVARFVVRRFGRELAERVFEPMMRGVYGASIADLGVRETMPKLAELERRYGSIGMALLLAPRAPAGPGLVSFRGGMQALVERLATAVAPSVRLGVDVESIRPGKAGSPATLYTSEGPVAAREIVLACPAREARRLLAPLDSALGDELAGVRSTDVSVVSLGYARHDVLHALDGTGFVVDPTLGRPLVACTWSSRKWNGRAPEDAVLLRCVVADGASTPELVHTATEEVRRFLGITAKPRLVRARRRNGALPVYAPGHRERVVEARTRARRFGVELAGNAYDGVGVPDCLSSGIGAAERVRAA